MNKKIHYNEGTQCSPGGLENKSGPYFNRTTSCHVSNKLEEQFNPIFVEDRRQWNTCAADVLVKNLRSPIAIWRRVYCANNFVSFCAMLNTVAA